MTSFIEFPSTIKNIAIYNASSVTSELPGSLLMILRSIHSQPEKITIVNNFLYEDDLTLYIIICPAGLGSERYIKGPKYYITYQLEPTFVLSREPYRAFLSGALYNWDYSRRNVEKLRSFGNIKSYYVPPGFAPTISSPDILKGVSLYSDENKDIDVLFLGWDAHERRQHIKNALINAGLNVLFIINLNLEQMQDIIKRSKICLNIHVVDDMPCLETIRLNILLSNQACIVSEDINDPEINIYKNMITSVPYDNIVETCNNLIKDFTKRRQIAIQSYQWYRNNRDWRQIVDFNYLLPTM